MSRNMKIVAAALVAAGLTAGPASATGLFSNVCYVKTDGLGPAAAYRLKVQSSTQLNDLLERPRSVAYDVIGKVANPGPNGVIPINGTVVVGTAARMLLTDFSSSYQCESNEASPIPSVWTCSNIIAFPTDKVTGRTITITRVAPRDEPLCSAAPEPSPVAAP
jgi:hypothetical protein